MSQENQEILLSLTFVFGVVYLFTKLIGMLAKTNLDMANSPLAALLNISTWERSFVKGLIILISNWFMYFSLCYQAWYWLFNN